MTVTKSSPTTLSEGDFVAIKDPKPMYKDGYMPTVHGYTHGTIAKLHKDSRYVIVTLPNGVHQRLPKSRCTYLKSKQEVLLHVLKNGEYQ